MHRKDLLEGPTHVSVGTCRYLAVSLVWDLFLEGTYTWGVYRKDLHVHLLGPVGTWLGTYYRADVG